MSIHENSLDSYEKYINSGAKYTQSNKILTFIKYRGRHTDRAIAAEVGIEINSARSAITRLIEDEKIEEVSDTVCPVSGRTVRIVDLPKGQADLSF